MALFAALVASPALAVRRGALLRAVSAAGCGVLAVSRRWIASPAAASSINVSRLRNIGISAHIDSGKTTLTERILFFTGRIKEMHEVRGRDGVGAFMDSMDLEREKGITIKSAATFTHWRDHHINIIDTPGHVDFTIEVERSLSVLDGAILVMCAVGGVQSQTMTVDRQMRRYRVPRITFINKMDRMGANIAKCIKGLRQTLGHNAALLQVPLGAEDRFEGVVDLVMRETLRFEGQFGEHVRREPGVPSELRAQCEAARRELIERVAEVDDELMEVFVMEQEPSVQQLKAAIRRVTLENKFTPVFIGSAYKNKGVQALLDGVVDYLPAPADVENFALDVNKQEQRVKLECDASKPLVALAFKLERGRFGQLTYVRVYQGTLKKGMFVYDQLRSKIKVPRLIRMHSDQMEDIPEAPAGEIAAFFGVECDTGTTFTDGSVRYAMRSMHVPDPVMSLSIECQDVAAADNLSKGLARFAKEDPTFRIHVNPETKQMIISGMGELHLEIYRERLQREYNVDVVVGKPQVNFRETITRRTDFSYLHKKQSGGAGQYGRVDGYMEPLPPDDPHFSSYVYENHCIGTNIPPEFYPAIEKGVAEAVKEGSLTGHPVQGVRVVITDGAHHLVDSNETAFRLAAIGAFRQGFSNAGPIVLEPLMSVEVETPVEFQGTVISNLTKRKGEIQSSETQGLFEVIRAHVPLNKMFGYSTDLRSITQGKATFSMEYHSHVPLSRDELDDLVKEYLIRRASKTAKSSYA